MRYINFFLNKNSFLANTIKIGISPILVQVLSIVFLPIISRIYNPNEFGQFAVFSVVLGFIGNFACLGYETSITLAKTIKEAVNLFLLCIVIVIFVSVFVTFIIFIIPDLNVDKVYFIIPLFILLSGFSMSYRYLHLTKKSFHFISLANVSGTLGNNIGTIFFGIRMNGSWYGLVWGSLVDSIAKLFFNLFSSRPSLIKEIRYYYSPRTIKFCIKKYIALPTIVLPTNIIMRLTSDLPILLFGFYFGPQVAAYFVFANKILNIPVSFVSNSIGEVFFQYSTEKEPEQIAKAIIKLLYFTLLIGLLPVMSFSFVAKDLFSIIFGNTWSDAGSMASFLSFSFLIKFISSYMTPLFLVFNKNLWNLIQSILNIFVVFAAFAIGYYFNNYLLAILIYSILSSLILIYFILLLLKNLNIDLWKIYNIIVGCFNKTKYLLFTFLLINYFFSLDDFFKIILFLIINLASILVNFKTFKNLIFRN